MAEPLWFSSDKPGIRVSGIGLAALRAVSTHGEVKQMKIRYLVAVVVFVLAGPVAAGEVDKGAVIGGAVGGGVGAGVGSKVGGTSGAIIGGALGGAAGAAIGSSATDEPKEKVVVKERVVEKEVRVVEVESPSGPPGHSKGKKKGWKKHHHDD